MTKNTTFHDLKGKSVYITGGGSGIGASLTDGFLAQGAKVAFIGRSDASAFVEEMAEKHGVAPLFLQGDITDIERLQGSIDEAAAAHGPIDVLVSNAANDQRHATADLSPEGWDRLQAINLKAYFFAAQAVAPGMQANGAGSIINFSSISYMMGNAGYPAYTAANGGITAMSRSLARGVRAGWHSGECPRPRLGSDREADGEMGHTRRIGGASGPAMPQDPSGAAGHCRCGPLPRF